MPFSKVSRSNDRDMHGTTILAFKDLECCEVSVHNGPTSLLSLLDITKYTLSSLLEGGVLSSLTTADSKGLVKGGLVFISQDGPDGSSTIPCFWV